MSNHEHVGCGGCGVSRRSFLATGCTACAGVTALPFVNTTRADDKNGKMKVRVVFELDTLEPVLARQGWPNIGYNFAPMIERTMSALNSRCEGIDFIASIAQANGDNPFIAEDAATGNIDGYFVFPLVSNGAVHTILQSGKPVLYADFLYCGTGAFLIHTAAHLRAKTPNFAFMSTGSVRDWVAAAQCFTLAKDGDVAAFVEGVTKVRIARTPDIKPEVKVKDKLDLLTTEELLKELKGKKLLMVEGIGSTHPLVGLVKESLGIELVDVPFAELNDLWENADKVKAAEIVKKWQFETDDIVDVPVDVLESSARMYLAQKACLTKYGACAITINCLGGFYGGAIHAYPCLGFHELLNEGLIGACERDITSTLTMIVLTTLTKGRPGFISDPVMDSSTREIIYTHCVAANKAFGVDGPPNPFTIMTHSEDRQGASVRSILPPGYMTTTVELTPERKQILFHQAVTVGNSQEDRACRTKLAAVPVGNYEKLFTQWDQWGWHRVTYYGDLREALFSLAKALGWEAVEEA